MNISRNDISDKEIMGTLNGRPVVLIKTHGGLNLIIYTKSNGASLNVLGSGSHRAFAKAQASSVYPDIQWDQNLWKAEIDLDDIEVNINEYRTAQYYAAHEFARMIKTETDQDKTKKLIVNSILAFRESCMSSEKAWMEFNKITRSLERIK
jgi:hypothetical protein